MPADNLPWIESPLFADILKEKNLSKTQLNLVKEYKKNGFVVIPGLLPSTLIDAVMEEVETKAFNPDFPISIQRSENRIQDFWQISEPARELAVYPAVLEMLKLFYDREPVPFQTLNFKFGTQQKAHSDTIHFSSLPAKFMCGVWVALEDITEENGPVFYYPGSQNLAEYDFSYIKTDAQATSYNDYTRYEDFIEKIVAANNLEKKQFLAKKGDLLIWSSNIIHGGSPVTKTGSTRWSQVTHYFFEDCYYYTPMLSNMATKEYFLRNDLVNIGTGEKVEQSYNGQHLRVLKTQRGLYTLLPQTTNFLSMAYKLIRGK